MKMDILQYIAKSFSECKDVGCYAFILNKAHTIYFGMMNEIPKGSVESGMLQLHPFVVLGAWAAYKLNLEKVGDKMVNRVVKAAKDGMKKIDNGLEGKL